MSTTTLRFLAVDLPSEPLFTKVAPDAPRAGYEVDVAQAVATRLGAELEWIFGPWSDMVPRLQAGEADAILCGQGVTEARKALVDFTRPYAVFNEAVLVVADSGIRSAGDLAGKRVLAIDGSTNLALAQTFAGAEVIPFAATGEDVLGDLVEELRSGRVDAVVDDEVVLHPICRSGDLEVAFSVATANRWAIAIAKDSTDRRALIDSALASAIADGALATAWRTWMPEIDCPAELLS